MLRKFLARLRVIPLWGKILVILVLVGLAWVGISRYASQKSSTPQYQTTAVEKGTLINSISGSGTITSGNNTNITTKVSGVVKEVYVTNGDTVSKGQKIASVSLDDYAAERQTTAWVNYLDATVAVKQAIADKTTADIAMWTNHQTVLDAQTAVDNNSYTETQHMIAHKTLDQTRKLFTVAESKYLNADADIAAAQSKVSSTRRDYQENSSTIIAPSAGVISNLALAPDFVIAASSATSNTSGATIVSSQTIGKIGNPKGQLIATVNLSEIDIVNVKANQKVTLTLDAFPDKTFTGKVLSVNTSGTVSSGVTNYPVTILLDSVSVDIYPNMSVNAQIITAIKTDVLLILSTAITTANDQSTVQVRKNNQNTTITVTAGLSNDSQTEITSGLNEGDQVVISVITAASQTQNSTISPFGSFGRTTTGRGGF